MKKKLIIAHEYGDDSHFEALFKSNNRIFEIEKSVILSRKRIFKKLYTRKFSVRLKDLILYVRRMIENIQFGFYKNRIIIFAVAPYDKLLLKYSKVIKNNYCIYFTSWPNWSENMIPPKGDATDRSEYLEVLSRFMNGVAFVNKMGAESLTPLINKPYEIVHHSIITGSYQRKNNIEDSKKVKILFLGKIIERKGITLIKNQLYDIKRQDFIIEFWGEGDLKTDLLEYSDKDNRVIVTGKRTKQYIKEHLRDYDYLLLPSKNEPFGIVLIEALAAGVPCIVSKNEGSDMIIQNGLNGLVFDKEDNFKSVLEKAIDIRINNLPMYKELHDQALKSSKLYDVDYIYKKWEKLLLKKECSDDL